MKAYYGTIKRCLWTILLIMTVQFGGQLRIPGVQTTELKSVNILNYFTNLSAGKISELTFFSLGLSPYMLALVLWSTLSMLDIDVIKHLSEKHSGIIRRILIFSFCLLQAIGTVFRFKDRIIYSDYPQLSTMLVNIFFVIILITGGMIVSYIAEVNTRKGIGKQMVIILPGLMANIPAMLLSGQEGGGLFTTAKGLMILLIVTVVFLYISVFLYKSEYRIVVQQTGLDISFKKSYIPIKVIPAGALPFMFGVTLFSLPQLLVNVKSLHGTTFLYLITRLFSYGTVPGIITYALILIILGYGFSHVNVRVYDIAKSLRDSGDYIFDVIPGQDTENYIRKKLNNMIILNNFYMVGVSVIPLVIGLKISGVTNLAFYFGSLFMIIVIIDSLHEDIRFMLAKRQYKLF